MNSIYRDVKRTRVCGPNYTIGDAKSVGLATATKAAHDVVNKVKVHDRDP